MVGSTLTSHTPHLKKASENDSHMAQNRVQYQKKHGGGKMNRKRWLIVDVVF